MLTSQLIDDEQLTLTVGFKAAEPDKPADLKAELPLCRALALTLALRQKKIYWSVALAPFQNLNKPAP